MKYVKKKNEVNKILFYLLIVLLFIQISSISMVKRNSRLLPEEVATLIRSNGESVVYIVFEGTPAVQGERIWRFGRYSVVKAKLRGTELQRILHHVANVYAIYPEATLSYPDYSSSLPLLEQDVKLLVHEPSGLWCGRGVTVAVIDSGVDYLHPDLTPSIYALVSTIVRTKEKQPLIWVKGVNGSLADAWALDQRIKQSVGMYAWMDEDGHGTHVVGIIASHHSKYRGLAPCARIVSVKAFHKEGGSIEQALDALEWVYHNVERFNIHILSVSWGAPLPSDGKDPLSVACDSIAEKGVLVFAAAGNIGNIPNTILAPAAARKVYAIGAWDGYQNKIAPFSSLGPTTDGRMKPDAYAVGVMVVSTRSRMSNLGVIVGENYAALSGTSMAAPAAAACAANFIEMFYSWNKRLPRHEDWETFMKMNSLRFNPFFKDFITGYGLVKCP